MSVLNHLGRNLYRSLITVLGEAISNAWDADAKNVRIYIDRETGTFVIKDDGFGMSETDFQDKFLRIGYSKREGGAVLRSPKDRPYIGAKCIGKLALLSCAEKISIVSKKVDTDYIGGVIDNAGLTSAIKNDLTPDEYPLGKMDLSCFSLYIPEHESGTIISFEETKEDIHNTISHLKKLIALYFRFALIDPEFSIYLNDELITLADIKDLSDATEFAWIINDLKDPYIETLTTLSSVPIQINNELNIKGFIATVKKPRYLKIAGTEEKVGIDLFVNGRLRERDILKHMPDFSTRYIASYLYGQIHFDELDQDGNDRFTSSREGVISWDDKYKELLKLFRESLLEEISNKWDELRLENGEDGDDENPRKNQKERRARSLYNLSAKEYSDTTGNVGLWIKQLQSDAEFNIPSYVDCFLSENLVRKFIKDKDISLEPRRDKINHWRGRETSDKANGNLTIGIRLLDDDIYYLDMEDLVKLTEPRRGSPPDTLLTDEAQFSPIRNAVMHTAQLTDEAKRKLTTVFDNIKGKINSMLSGE